MRLRLTDVPPRGRLLAVLAGLAVVSGIWLAGCSSSPAEPADAGAAAVKFQTVLTNDGYARLYDLAHPAIKSVVTREKFLECAARDAAGVSPDPFIRLKPVQTWLLRDLVDDAELERWVPWEDEPQVVSLEITRQTGALARRWFVVRSKGAWRWYLTSGAMTAYERGDCPPASTP
jgi:hypothetical protein